MSMLEARNFKKLDMDEFRLRLSVDHVFISANTNVNDLVNQLKVTVTNILDDLVPLRRITKRRCKP